MSVIGSLIFTGITIIMVIKERDELAPVALGVLVISLARPSILCHPYGPSKKTGDPSNSLQDRFPLPLTANNSSVSF